MGVHQEQRRYKDVIHRLGTVEAVSLYDLSQIHDTFANDVIIFSLFCAVALWRQRNVAMTTEPQGKFYTLRCFSWRLDTRAFCCVMETEWCYHFRDSLSCTKDMLISLSQRELTRRTPLPMDR